MGEMDAVVSEFLVESDENLSQVERDLVDLEGTPEQETLASIFRAVHTIKGTCAFLGYTKLESLAHIGETLLSLVRDGELSLTPDITSALLSMVDAIRQMLTCIEQAGNDGDEDFQDLKQRLVALQGGSLPVTSTPQSEDSTASPIESSNVEDAAISQDQPSVISESREESAEVEHHTPDQDSHDDHQSTPKAETRPSTSDTRGPSAVDSTIRVDVGLLDRLMNMVGELVLTRNQILQSTAGMEDGTLMASSQRLSLITTELQEGIMKTRMQQIGNIWSKFPRVVRDLSIACGKEIRIEMEGKETELDKTLIEAIKDPLTHLVRNTVDHGIEAPEIREKNGKPREGCLLLRSYHEGGQVNIEITDDGGGINTQRVAETAVKRGVVKQEEIAQMQERELLNLIFLPGFSTAEKVTNVSGRGVGMDVVKTNIEKIGGTIDISTKLGEGTTFKLKVPLTLAIIPALVVTSGGERFAIPQISLLELLRLEGEQVAKSIELVHGAPVYRLRGQLLPLVYLNQVVQLSSSTEKAENESDIANIVVLQADGHRFGLVVDEVNDTEEIVVKPLGKQLKGLPIYAGVTIMGDGRVALILDVWGLVQRAKISAGDKQHTEVESVGEGSSSQTIRQTLLLVQVGTEGRVAIPLSKVARLEKVKASEVESAGGEEVMQYRGDILSLARLSTVLAIPGCPDEQEDTTKQLVVIAHEGQQAGLIVERIVDIVNEAITTQAQTGRPGIIHSTVIQQHVTDVIDVPEILASMSCKSSSSSLSVPVEV